jgi:PQQ-dependent catabolism-associated CXXCW motif protein
MNVARFSLAIVLASTITGSATAQDSFGGQPGIYPPQQGAPQAQGGWGQPQPDPNGEVPWGQQPQDQGDWRQQPQGQAGWGQQPQGQAGWGQQPQGQGSWGQQPQGQAGWGQQPQGQAGWGQQPQGQGSWGQQPQGQAGWGQQPQGQGSWGQQPAPGPQAGGANLDQLMQMERQDFGVPPPRDLHAGAMHGPTPVSIPGGQLITTKGLMELVRGGQVPYFLFDVLGGQESLPNAMPAVWLAQPGSFNDQTQQQFAQILRQGTQGRTDIPLVFYCAGIQCWMSYNAALRAINAGYTNVLWYRGGLEAWKAAGLPTQPAWQAFQQQGQQQGMPQQR